METKIAEGATYEMVRKRPRRGQLHFLMGNQRGMSERETERHQ